MTSEESVASMTDEQIAESLEITPRCLACYEPPESFPEDRKAFKEAAAIIRNRSAEGFDVSEPIQRIAKLADQLERIPAWIKRALVYRRAVSILEQIAA